MTKQWIKAGTAGLVVAVGISTTAWGHSDRGPRHAAARLDGYQENPSISTTGRGRLILRLDHETETIDYELSYSGLEGGTAMQAHIHFARARVNGQVSVFLCGGGGKDPCPLQQGTVRGTITAADIAAGNAATVQGLDTFEEFVRALRARATYANVHSTRWGGGEIRGQIFEISHRDD